MTDGVMIAGVQSNPKILEKAENLTRCLEDIRIAVEQGAKLVIFPECALTGYCYTSLEEAKGISEPINGPSLKKIAEACKRMTSYAIIGFLESDHQKIHNSLAFIGPEGLIGRYRKIHLPFLGVDRFVYHGNEPFRVYGTAIGSIGLNICYDAAFPESSRVLMLMGAELIVLPTNWPCGVEYYPEHIIPTRAIENRVNYAAINRVGTERGFRFCGRSKIVDCNGNTLAEANPSEEEIIYARIYPEKAKIKVNVKIPGEWETDRIGDRRPEFYTAITSQRHFGTEHSK